jgi:hypothetical protein
MAVDRAEKTAMYVPGCHWLPPQRPLDVSDMRRLCALKTEVTDTGKTHVFRLSAVSMRTTCTVHRGAEPLIRMVLSNSYAGSCGAHQPRQCSLSVHVCSCQGSDVLITDKMDAHASQPIPQHAASSMQ